MKPGSSPAAATEAVERDALRRFTTPRRTPSPEAPDVPNLAMHRTTVHTPSARLAVWEWGDGPAVLLVHGWNGSAAQMSGFVAPLVRAGLRAVAFDQPAHGHSSGESAALSDMIDAVLAVAWMTGPVTGIIAHSLGATAATLALRRGLLSSSAVLLAPPVDVPYFARAFAASLGLPDARARGMLQSLSHRLGADLAAFDLRRVAPGLRTPVLLAHDPDDQVVPFEHTRALAELWPGAHLHRLERLGHQRMLDDDTVIAEAARFVATLALTRPPWP